MDIRRLVLIAHLSGLMGLIAASNAAAQSEASKAKEKPPASKADAKDGVQNESQSEIEPIDAEARANSISIQGTVLNADGHPARWSPVWLSGMVHLPGGRYRALQVASTRTDINGKFQFWHPCWKDHDPAPQEHSILWVVSRAPGRVLTSIATLNLTNEYRDKREIHGLELKALPQADYRGRVVDADGRPLPNTKVGPTFLTLAPRGVVGFSAMAFTPELTAQYEVETDKDGQFTLAGLPEAKTIIARIAPPGFDEREMHWVTVGDSELRVEPGGTIRGSITNAPTQDFCDQIELLIRTSNRRQPGPQEPTINFTAQFRPESDGNFEIADVPPGQYQISILPKQAGLAVPQEFYVPVDCESRSGDLTENVQLTLPDVISIHGRVVDAVSGEGVAGVAVSFYKQHEFRSFLCAATTNADGEYRAFLRPGKIVIEPARGPKGYLSPLDDLQSPAIEYTKDFEGPTFKYERAITFRGVVLNDDEKPVPQAEIRWFQPGRKGVGLQDHTLSDQQGRFEIPQVDPTDALPIRVRHPSGVSASVLVQSNDLVEPKPIVISPTNGFRLKGTLVSQSGKRIEKANIDVHWHRRYASTKTRMYGMSSKVENLKSNQDGEFESSLFWAGDEYHLSVQADGFTNVDLAIVKGDTGRIHDYGKIVLKGSSRSIAGRVIDADGQPVADVTVFNSGDATDVVTTSTDENGQFHLQGPLDGPAYVFAQHRKFRMAAAYASESAQEVTLTMTPLSSPSPARPPIDFKSIDANQKEVAGKLATWVQEKGLPFRPNLRDSRFSALARSNPDEALLQIGNQSAAMDYRSAIIIADELTPRQFRKEAADSKAAEAVATAIKFVERAESRIPDLSESRRNDVKVAVGLKFLRLGCTDRGKALVEDAIKQFEGPSGPNDHRALTIAQALAWYDVPRALKYRNQVTESYSKTLGLNRIVLEVSRYDIPQALQILKDSNADTGESNRNDRLLFDLAFRIGRVEPQIATDLVSQIVNSRTKAEAAGWLAVSIAEDHREQAISLIDLGFAELQRTRRSAPNSFYYEYVPGVAAHLAAQAAQIDYPDIEQIIVKVLALRIPASSQTSTAGRLQATVNAALYLAFVDPNVSKRLLTDLETELEQSKLLGQGGSGRVSQQQWLYAWAMTDPEHAAKLLRTEMEVPFEDGKPPYWIDSVYTAMFLPRSEQLAFIRRYSSSNLSTPDRD